MSTSLKRHPSGEPEESPEAKRTNTKDLSEITPVNLANTLLKQPTQVEGQSMTDSISTTASADAAASTSIINTGFKLSTGTALFSNGNSEGSSNNIFAQALSASNSNSIFGQAVAGNASGGGFLFGKNLSDRAVTVTASTEAPSGSSVADKEKVTFTETKVTSGEEDEKRLLQTNCKLYQFCSTKKVWLERGSGTLRLNECTTGKRPVSRLVVRSSAVMKVMLNTRIFADMFINRPNASTLRISAQDDGKLSTFLIKCSKIECDKLYNLLIKKRELERDHAEDEEEEAESSKEGETNGDKEVSNGEVKETSLKSDETLEEKNDETDEKAEKVDSPKNGDKAEEVAAENKNSSQSETTTEG